VRRICLLAILLVGSHPVFAQDAKHTLTTVNEVPAGLSDEIKADLAKEGFRVSGEKGPMCDVWLLEKLAVKEKFSPTFTINYPFVPGQLIGVLRVPEKTIFKDFRGQELKTGTYTLRYGQQPEDGNHIGTSDLADFLLALPAKIDTSRKVMAGFDNLSQHSSKSAGSSHPAIFSLLPVDSPVKKAELVHDGDTEFWVLQIFGKGSSKDSKPVSIRVVAIGQSEA
jgi:hypothetical protein